ncbi:MAG TPA: hypothetical protein QGF58_10520 [Myxococcota bacterium]|nr:hypothetical protein [Myxococcota bacterium]
MLHLWLCLASATPVHLFLGGRASDSTAGTLDGVRLGARYDVGPAAVEANAFLNPLPARYDGLDAMLVSIAYQGDSDVEFQQPVFNDIFAFQLLLDATVVPLTTDNFNGGPHVFAGLELARIEQQYFLRYDPDSGLPMMEALGLKVRPGGVVGGIGMDAWFRDRVGLRVAWSSRIYLEEEPSYDPDIPVSGSSVQFNPTTTADIMVRL